MKCVRAISGELIGPVVRKSVPEPPDGTFALVVKRRDAELLTLAGQFHIGQALDGFKKIVDAGLGQYIETPVGPELVDRQKGSRLRVVAVFGLKKNSRVANGSLSWRSTTVAVRLVRMWAWWVKLSR